MVETMGNGIIWALLGAAIATGVAGIGSIKGVGMAAETAMGAMSEDSSKFGKMLVLVLLPGTQGLYGFIVTVMMLMNIGVLGGSADMSLTKGLLYLTASLPIAVGGLLSGIAQGRAAVSGLPTNAKSHHHCLLQFEESMASTILLSISEALH